jgi:HK97 family phage major capsid protein
MNVHTRTRGLIAAFSNDTSPAAVLAGLNTAFAEFKVKNDGKLDGIEKEIDSLNAKLSAARVGGAGDVDPDAPSSREERLAIGSYAKSGSETGIKAMASPRAGMSSDSDPDGGYTVTPTISKQISKKVFDVSPIGRLARRVTIERGNAFEEPIDRSDIGAEWVGETQERPALDTSKLRYLSVPLMEIYTSQPITQRLLDDTDFNLGQWLEGKIADKFARSEGAAYVNGNGIGKPRGLLTYYLSSDRDAARAWGTMQVVKTGVDGGFKVPSTTVSPADSLFDVVYSLRAPYRPNARWLMNLLTAGAVRKLKDSEGRFVWADAREGQPATLCGFPVELDEEMPDIGTDTLSIAFGDFNQAYIIVDRPGLRLMRDPFTAKPHVLFYAYRRVGGGLQNSEAVKLLQFGD